MKKTTLALGLALALSAPSVFAATQPVAPQPAPDANHGQTQKKAVDLNAVEVSTTLDQSRNALSPETGSSQYVMTQHAIQKLPLGDATPVNQVLLQAPGVVKDSYGGLHVRGDHGNLQYRINGVIIPESISGFGQTLDTRIIHTVKLLDGALPAQYGERTAAVVDITTKNGHSLGNGGSVGVTGGSFGTINPNASVWGSSGRWSFFGTANYLQSDVGIENPTSSRKPIHDHTNQVKGFGDLSYLVNDHTRVSFMFGVTNNRFQIPNNPDQQPAFQYMNQTAFNSADLNERQNETTRFGVLSLQGQLGKTDYQVSLGQRYSSLDFMPDRIGDLMFNGVSSAIDRSNRASTLQADFSTPLNDTNTLRYGLYGSFERALSTNNAYVFPADANGNQTSTTPINIFDGNRIIAKTWAAYVQDEWSIGDKWTVNYGLRGDKYQAFRTESQLSPRLGVVYQATDNTTVHAGYARYFTPPATELISTDNIAKFAGTTNALDGANGNDTPLSQRSDYFDLGVQQNIGNNLTLGLDAYYRKVRRLQDEGQFGAALVYSTFNYAKGRVHGVEFTANYASGPLSAYFNLALSRAMGERVITSQYNFAPEDLAYVADHYIHLDHDQKLASSGGVSYDFGDATSVGANYILGSGLRKDGSVPNGASLPYYFQLNLSVSHDFTFADTGKLHTQLAVINALDRTYELRDGSGIGVGAPQFGPRRGLYLTVQKHF
ncbi:TonB-dependent receptor [Oleiagrimonas sp. MCCC 1A03011]|uniref:TonB-dependent receptor n=1 Tax=Oleiagrimonas sp. MCCC 1A03011 TaxID=1926883 RepID=UPI000DC4FD20|nr:TonB-dependent receptor [Oleiagrimonas sp. MCCC 1A03011]RAP58246.1 TonB-dependent receptor [Oleiagrimonas sp. MCCC 1A03011]